ncbi:MAG TPA: M1 family aminopeptidase [Vicinamibacterales bacterium]|jgi:aminopeptidase N|nr:M1 family aminopeptidase [Vicinamibacterales bacterium]
MKYLAALLMLLAPWAAFADTYPRQPGIDAIHYVFRLTLVDSSNEVAGEATVQLRVAEDNVTEAVLDLASAGDRGGMTVSSVTNGAKRATFSHADNRLRIGLPRGVTKGQDVAFTIQYRGVPAEGLRLIPNIHGERTIFSENWPHRARHWLPMIDHPYDKATCEFVITAPAHYQVVSNGVLVEETDLADGRRRTHWKQSVPISSWLYALGVARFTVHHAGLTEGVPLQTWVFPQDREPGLTLFEETSRQAMAFFAERIGPYSYEKLANVEAAGLSGGTEHASAIFYGEKGVTKGRGPVVHEVAHQWWGNSVTERDWDDVWLSEGFATYFTMLFTEHAFGRDAFAGSLRASRETVLETERKSPETPVIHRNLSDMSKVLNSLVYQKGGWVLHMLRGLIGTEPFWQGIREYYRRYRNGNASTDDFRAVMEGAAGRDLRWFFDQWLTRPGTPRIEGSWHFDAARKQIDLELSQSVAGAPYRLPIEIGVVTKAGDLPRIERFEFNEQRATFQIAADAEPAAVVLDPNTWLLHEGGLSLSSTAKPRP